MGRDKARLRLARRSMLSIVRAAADPLNLPVRVIRRDLVARCGPLGGVFTALRTTKADAVLFMACDMPLVTPRLLRRIIRASRACTRAVFSKQESRVGFPLLLPRAVLADVQAQVAKQELSIHALAAALNATTVELAESSPELFNVNTPADAREAAECLASCHNRNRSASRSN